MLILLLEASAPDMKSAYSKYSGKIYMQSREVPGIDFDLPTGKFELVAFQTAFDRPPSKSQQNAILLYIAELQTNEREYDERRLDYAIECKDDHYALLCEQEDTLVATKKHAREHLRYLRTPAPIELY